MFSTIITYFLCVFLRSCCYCCFCYHYFYYYCHIANITHSCMMWTESVTTKSSDFKGKSRERRVSLYCCEIKIQSPSNRSYANNFPHESFRGALNVKNHIWNQSLSLSSSNVYKISYNHKTRLKLIHCVQHRERKRESDGFSPFLRLNLCVSLWLCAYDYVYSNIYRRATFQ